MFKIEKFVLCRRDLADIGQPKKFCAKPIKKRNPLDWCEDCYSRRLIWPGMDVPADKTGAETLRR
jgi:hypothetical protein